MKRLVVATLSGLLFGFVCFGFACSGSGEVNAWLGVSIIAGRTLLGFGIGISRFPMGNWAIHGLVMGLLFSLPMAFGAMMGPENPEMSAQAIAISTVVMGVVYGFLIELITTVVFKARLEN